MNLLDSSLNCYIVSGKKGGTRNHIFDIAGNEIGSVRHKRVPDQAKISLEAGGSTLCTIHVSLVGSRYVYVAKFPDGKIIGRAKQSPVDFRDYIDWYDSEGEKVFRAHSKITKWEFHVLDSMNKDQVCAKIKRANTAINVVDTEIGKNGYEITIVDDKASRLSLLVLAIVIITHFQNHDAV